MRRAILIFLPLCLLAGCASAPHSDSDDTAVSPEALGEHQGTRRSRARDPHYLPDIEPFEIDTLHTYYTSVNFWYEYKRHLTTNYQRGVFVPVNSRVRLSPVMYREVSRRRMDEIAELTVRLIDSKTTIRIMNVSRHAKVPLNEVVYRMFTPEPVDLSVFDEKTQLLIKSGTLRKGMTKYQVLLTRGYPPTHETPSLESDTWTYWSSRFSSHVLFFSNGMLTSDPN